MVGATGTVLAHRSSELGHRHQDDVGLSRPEVGPERRHRSREVVGPAGEGSLRGALLHVGIPPSGFDERHLEPDVRLDELRDLAQRAAERTCRIARTGGRAGIRDTTLGKEPERVEALASGIAQKLLRRLVVERRKPAPATAAAPPAPRRRTPKAFRSGIASAASGPGERSRQGRGRGDGAKRRRVVPQRAADTIEPARGGPLAPGRTALHVVLGVEVRTRRVG